jgi:hypothetical protein
MKNAGARLEVNVVDPLVRKGYRFEGWGVVHRSDEVFQRGCQKYRDMGLTLEVRALVWLGSSAHCRPSLPRTTGVIQKNGSKTAGASIGASFGRESKSDGIALWVKFHLSGMRVKQLMARSCSEPW